jgi:hypothetical protein
MVQRGLAQHGARFSGGPVPRVETQRRCDDREGLSAAGLSFGLMASRDVLLERKGDVA